MIYQYSYIYIAPQGSSIAMKKLSEEDIDQVLNEKLPIKHWELQLGVGYAYEGYSGSAKFSKPYPEIGAKFWILIQGNLQNFLCEDGKPKEWLNDLISGDIRNAVTGIVSAITAQYNVTIAIAVPIAALVLKYDLISFCSTQFKKEIDIEEIKNQIKDKTIEKQIVAENRKAKIKKLTKPKRKKK